jgi:hypothetical protein
MNIREFREALARSAGATIHFMLPDGEFVPAHFHITEVGRVRKDFIDCGGTVRQTTSCLFQVWVADDVEHRLNTSKLAQIVSVATPLLGADDLPVEVEYESGAISQYPVSAVEFTPAGLLFHLGSKHTACLAPEKCGVPLPGVQGCC